MGGWMPAIPPEMMAAALARRGGVPAAAPPPPTVGPQPLGTRRPVTLPPGNPGPLPSSAPPPAPAAPIRMGAGGRNLAEANPPGVGANGTPYVPPSYTPPISQPKPPSPSDDPAISPEMRKAMQSTQSAQAALDTEGQKYQDLSTKAAALQPPNYENYKPPLWKKILAPVVGAVAGRSLAEPAVNTMLNGRFQQAQQGYEQQKSALQQQLEAERGIGIPLAESRARVAQESFTNQLNTQKEAREEKTAQSNAEYKSDLNEIRQMYDEGRINDAQTRLNETAERNKNDAARSNELLDLKRQLVGIEQQNANTKAAKDGADQNGMTASEQRDFNAKTRRYAGEIDSLNRERAQMVGIPGDFATKRTAAIDKRLDELHGNIDKAEQDIMDRRPQKGAAAPGGSGAPGKPGAWTLPKGAEKYKPNSEASQLKDAKGNVVAKAVKDKSGNLGWGPPQ